MTDMLKQGDIIDIQYGFGAGEDQQLVSISAHWSSEHGFMFSTKDVAEALGCKEANIRKHKLKEEIRQDHHWVLESQAFPERKLSGRPGTYWTHHGVIRLGMLTQGERSAAFRDCVEQIMADFEWDENQAARDKEDVSRALMGKEVARSGLIRKESVTSMLAPAAALAESLSTVEADSDSN